MAELTTIGVLGAGGTMGRPIARNLANAGFTGADTRGGLGPYFIRLLSRLRDSGHKDNAPGEDVRAVR
jgi:hypothetical protein